MFVRPGRADRAPVPRVWGGDMTGVLVWLLTLVLLFCLVLALMLRFGTGIGSAVSPRAYGWLGFLIFIVVPVLVVVPRFAHSFVFPRTAPPHGWPATFFWLADVCGVCALLPVATVLCALASGKHIRQSRRSGRVHSAEHDRDHTSGREATSGGGPAIRRTLLVICVLLPPMMCLLVWGTSYVGRLSMDLYSRRPWSLNVGCHDGKVHTVVRQYPIPSLKAMRPNFTRWERFGFTIWIADMMSASPDDGQRFAYGRAWRFRAPAWFVAGLLALPAAALLLPGYLRRRRLTHRLRHNLCLNCGYSLAGNVSGTCPECGERI